MGRMISEEVSIRILTAEQAAGEDVSATVLSRRECYLYL